MQVEAERRAFVMFGENWQSLCSTVHDIRGTNAISLGGKTLAFTWEFLRTWDGLLAHDMSDGSPADIAYWPDGTVRRIEHFRDGTLNDPEDGSPAVICHHEVGTLKSIGHFFKGSRMDTDDNIPAHISYFEDGDIEGGISSVRGKLDADQVIKMLKAVQVSRVADLLTKADQAVVPSGMPLPENAIQPAAAPKSKDGR